MNKIWPFRKKRKVVVRRESLSQQLVNEKARLARIELLPESDFRPRLASTPFNLHGAPIAFSIDNKIDAIARCKANIAELEVRIAARAKK